MVRVDVYVLTPDIATYTKTDKMFHTGKTKIMSKLVVKVHDHLLIAPLTT